MKWNFDFLEHVAGAQPNGGHVAIANYMKWAKDKDGQQNHMVVTTSIDGLMAKAMAGVDSSTRAGKEDGSEDFAMTEGVFEIHGNATYMRSPDFTDKKWYSCPSKADFEASGGAVPRCEESDSVMRPHIRLHLEPYLEEYYRVD